MTNRRQFLQMLGIGGATLAMSTTAAANPVVPLFSGRNSKIWTPEHTNLTRSHVVLVRPKQVPWGKAPTPKGADPRVPRLHRESWPKTAGQGSALEGGPLYRRDNVLRHMDAWGDNPAAVAVRFKDGEDPHHAFYRAAMQMRENFARHSHARLEAEFRRGDGKMLVTLVDTPIFATAVPTDDGHVELFAEISYTPYVLNVWEDLDPNNWEVYSENGEYPIEVPTDIDMDRLLRVETEIFTGKYGLSTLGGKIIVP